MSNCNVIRSFVRRIAGFCAISLAGCSSLLPAPPQRAQIYQLDGAFPHESASARVASPTTQAGPTLVVQPPRAAPGFDTRYIVYVREPHKLERFAHSEWVDSPSRMLSPLVVSAIEATGRFSAVGSVTSGLSGGLRLDTEVLRLQHDFTTQPSQVRFTLRAALLDGPTRRVVTSKVFDVTAPAATDDPYGGVVTANQVVQSVVNQLARFCADAAGSITLPH